MRGELKFRVGTGRVSAPRIARPSPLDVLDEESAVCRSGWQGVLVMIKCVACMWVLTTPITRYYENGAAVDVDLLKSVFADTPLLMGMWLVSYIFTASAWGCVRLRIFLADNKLTSVRKAERVAYLIAAASELILALSLHRLSVIRLWSTYPAVFTITVVTIFLMKMHAYVATSFDLLRQDELLIEIEGKGAAEPAYVVNTGPGTPSLRKRSNIQEDASGSVTAASSAATSPSRDQGQAYTNVKDHLTLLNFAQYMCLPTLVYELTYPRNRVRFRKMYFLQKLGGLISSLTLIFLISSNFVIPIVEEAYHAPIVYTVARLVLPLFAMDLMFFYMMFECILNLFGEMMDYGDRQFYQDWWNCTTWEEFSRKWNHIVHEFLLANVYRRIYDSSPSLTKPVAGALTFLVSAVVHELFLAAVLGFFTGWIFIFMMVQIPLIALSKYHKGTVWGNYYFWIGISIGIPLLVTAYATPASHRWASL